MSTNQHSLTDFNKITENIISCAFTVSNRLGTGFLEKVYEKAMIFELKENEIFVESQKPINVTYKGYLIGEYYADLFVENKIIVELKAVKQIEKIHKAQLLNYLKACNLRYGLLLNFGNTKVEIKRVVNGY